MTRLPFNISATELSSLSNWWDEINESTQWQNDIFFFLCTAYALVSYVALVGSIPLYLSFSIYVFGGFDSWVLFAFI
ncbi:hypothetical protein AAC387_Pa01g2100 [Persea americana]